MVNFLKGQTVNIFITERQTSHPAKHRYNPFRLNIINLNISADPWEPVLGKGLWKHDTKIHLLTRDVKGNVGRPKGTAQDQKHPPRWWWGCYSLSLWLPQVQSQGKFTWFIDDVNSDSSGQINFEVYRSTLSSSSTYLQNHWL